MNKYDKITQKAFDKQSLDEIELYQKYKPIFNIPAGELVNNLDYVIRNYQGHGKIKQDLFNMGRTLHLYMDALDMFEEDLSAYLPDRDFRFGHHGDII